MLKYITKDYIDFTQDNAFKSTIEVRDDIEHNENEILENYNANLFYRVAKIDDKLYYYLSKDEIDKDVIKAEVERLSASPL